MNKLYLHFYKMGFQRLPLMALLFCLPLFSTPVLGQDQSVSLDVPHIVPVSPATTAMEKYQSYPIDHCTGIPNITIPLYEIVAGEVIIPVTLSYHASGLKPKDRSGVAGTGWTLNLEPSISRRINAVADDDQYGWFNRHRSWNTLPSEELALLNYYRDKADNRYDTQPDKFTYKLPHGGGGGYFQESFSPLLTIPRNNDKVEYNHASGMEITDENGVHYSFNDVCEKSGDNITRWLCSSIQSARNPAQELVSFSYCPMEYYLHPNEYYNLDEKLVFASKKKGTFDRRVIMIDTSTGSYYRLQGNGWSGKPEEATLEMIKEEDAGISYSPSFTHLPGDVSAAFLSEARFMGNRLSVSYKNIGGEVNYSKVLDEIEVTNGYNVLVRSIKFYITQYNSRTSLTKLDSVRISAPGAEDRVYSFRYNSTGSVPSIYTKAVDHWGFCNGPQTSGGKTVPSLCETIMLDTDGFANMKPFEVNYSGANRNPNAEWTRTGILNMITDPQGVQTNFLYEGNFGAFRDQNKDSEHRDYLHPVGGLRIAEIETYEPQTRKRIRKFYKYGLTKPEQVDYEPVWGGGAIKHIVTQRDYVSSVTLVPWDIYTNETWSEDLTFYSSMPVSNIAFNNGCAVMYNVVSEVIMGGDRVFPKTMYYYNVEPHDFETLLRWEDDDPSGSVKNFLANSITDETKYLVRKIPYLSYEIPDDFTSWVTDNQRGALLLRTEYFRNDELVASKENVYSEKIFWEYMLEITIYERRLIIDPELYILDYSNIEDSPYVSHLYYVDISSYQLLDKEITRRYYTVNGYQDTVTTEKKYTYNFDFGNPGFSLKPRQMETVLSNGTETVDEYDYLANYPGILSYHKQTEGDHSRESRILFKPQSCLPEKVQSRTDGLQEYRDEVVYRRYDGNNNIVEIAGKDSVPISFIWGYCNRFPIARIENATIDEVYAALNVSDVDEWASSDEPDIRVWRDIKTLGSKLPNARVTSYDYNPLHGVISITDPNNMTTNFDYDSYSRLTDEYYFDADFHKVMLQKYIYHFGK